MRSAKQQVVICMNLAPTQKNPKITSELAKRAARNNKLGCYDHNLITLIHIWKQYNHSNME